jgi:hypothetical protein
MMSSSTGPCESENQGSSLFSLLAALLTFYLSALGNVPFHTLKFAIEILTVDSCFVPHDDVSQKVVRFVLLAI